MFQIRKQIHNMLFLSAFGSFRVAGASWAALLAVRGFSMLEIGIAESCFHMASFLFEIPSGVVSDVFGRKRSMILSQCMMVLSSFFMVLSGSLGSVCFAMILSALGYNFTSGTREALAYDSLLKAGKEEHYMEYSSLELTLYRMGNASATLCAGLALIIGYRKAYLIDVFLGLCCLFFSFRLEEVTLSEEEHLSHNIAGEIKNCFKESFLFLRNNFQAEKLMLWNAFVGAVATLLLFFLQPQLPLSGLPEGLLGPALFFMSLGGAAGAWAAPLFGKWSYRRLSIFCITGIGVSFLLGVCQIPLAMAAGGFAASFCDDMFQVRSDVILNHMFPSSQRATLLSVSSLCFSLVMIVLSPLIGSLFGTLGH